MHITRSLILAATFACAAGTASDASLYKLIDTYNTTNFFSSFDFIDAPDPTRGFVDYSAANIANSTALAGYAQNAVYIGVDHTTKNPEGGRKSVRLESKMDFTQGLIVADIAHMPKQVCGSWPAFWTANTNEWPASGEIDIIEGVNLQETNSVTLHTAEGCSMTNAESPATVMKFENCNQETGFVGCGQHTKDATNYGGGFNSVGGGVYAMDWTSQYINVYFFSRDKIPADLTAGEPNPKAWGAPTASFTGKCDIDSHFKNHKIIINNTFCGDWAGNVWKDQCSEMAATCDQFVAENPEAFEDVYWLINHIKVYKQQGTAGKKRDFTTRAFSA